MITLSIRPMDLKMAIPKTQEMSKVEQNNQNNPKVALQAQINEQNQMIEQQLKQVNENDELSKSKIEEDEERKQQNKNRNKQSQEDAIDSKEDEPEILKASIGKDYSRGAGIDIKV